MVSHRGSKRIDRAVEGLGFDPAWVRRQVRAGLAPDYRLSRSRQREHWLLLKSLMNRAANADVVAVEPA
jgi:hypothetical protein